MTAFLFTLPYIPGVEVGIHENGLSDKQRGIQYGKHHIKLIDERGRELRVGGKKNENKQTTCHRRHTEEDDRHLGDLFSQAIIPRVLLAVTQPF